MTWVQLQDYFTRRQSAYLSPAAGSNSGATHFIKWSTFAAPGTSGENPTSATTGSIRFRNAGGGTSLYIPKIDVVGNAAGRDSGFILADWLWRCGGYDGTDTALKSVTSSINRGDTTGIGVLAFMEMYSALGTSAATLTVIYTNQAGTGSRTGTVDYPAGGIGAFTMIPIALQSGDTGVRSIESFQLSGSTGAAGSYGMTLLRPLLAFQVNANPDSDAARGPLQTAMPKVDNSACLSAFGRYSGFSGASYPRGPFALIEA